MATCSWWLDERDAGCRIIAQRAVVWPYVTDGADSRLPTVPFRRRGNRCEWSRHDQQGRGEQCKRPIRHTESLRQILQSQVPTSSPPGEYGSPELGHARDQISRRFAEARPSRGGSPIVVPPESNAVSSASDARIPSQGLLVRHAPHVLLVIAAPSSGAQPPLDTAHPRGMRVTACGTCQR